MVSADDPAVLADAVDAVAMLVVRAAVALAVAALLAAVAICVVSAALAEAVADALAAAVTLVVSADVLLVDAAPVAAISAPDAPDAAHTLRGALKICQGLFILHSRSRLYSKRVPDQLVRNSFASSHYRANRLLYILALVRCSELSRKSWQFARHACSEYGLCHCARRPTNDTSRRKHLLRLRHSRSLSK